METCGQPLLIAGKDTRGRDVVAGDFFRHAVLLPPLLIPVFTNTREHNHDNDSTSDTTPPQPPKQQWNRHTMQTKVADGDKASEKIARDRAAQRGTVAALSRDIAAVKQREEAAVSGSEAKSKKGGSSGGLARLNEAKAAVRVQ